jgi:AcrR family transcriptional regulator
VRKLSLLHRREGIIISTIEALHEVGIQNLSTKEIAKREGVSEGTLFRHFKNKTDILLAVLEHFSQYDDDIIQACMSRNLDPIETIKNYMSTYAIYYQNYPEITAIMQAYNSLMSDEELVDTVKAIFWKRWNFLSKLLEDAKVQGMIDINTDSSVLADLIAGGFRETCLRWRIESYSFSLKDRATLAVEMIMQAFTNENYISGGGKVV